MDTDINRRDAETHSSSAETYHPWRGGWLSIRDTPDWRKKYPLGPVRFDVRCNVHSVEFKDISPENLPGCPETFRAFLTCCSAPAVK